MYNDILGSNDLTEDLFTEEMHPSWCAVFCIIQLNNMVDDGVMEMSDGGEKPILVTETGEKNAMYYFNEVLGREPNEEDINIGMAVLKNEGLI